MWYTDTELAGIDDFDHRNWEARRTDDGRYLIWTSEGVDPMPVGLPLDFDDAVGVIRWIREGGLRDYRRGIIHHQLDRGHLRVELLEDLSTVPTDATGLRGQVVFVLHAGGTMTLGPDLPVPHATAVCDWLLEDDTLAA